MTRILHLDDNPRELELMQLALDEAGYHGNYEGAINASEAMKALLEGRSPLPDLLLIDLSAPRATHQVLRQLLLRKRPLSMQVVVLTASADALTNQATQDLGADAIYAKPTTFRKLVTVMRKILVACTAVDHSLP